jgi:hypothetical protein
LVGGRRGRTAPRCRCIAAIRSSSTQEVVSERHYPSDAGHNRVGCLDRPARRPHHSWKVTVLVRQFPPNQRMLPRSADAASQMIERADATETVTSHHVLAVLRRRYESGGRSRGCRYPGTSAPEPNPGVSSASLWASSAWARSRPGTPLGLVFRDKAVEAHRGDHPASAAYGYAVNPGTCAV